MPIPTRQPQPPPLLTRRPFAHLLTPLHPLLSTQTGHAHPSFPPTLLHYHLLSEPVLDALASHYHQRSPCAQSTSYPLPLTPGKWKLEEELGMGVEARVRGKRRRFGRFIGLRGCESPVGEEEEQVRRWVEGRMGRGGEREREEEVWRRKFGW